MFGYCVLAGIMCLFLSFSVTMLTNDAFQEPVAYQTYEVIDGEAVLTEELSWEEYTELQQTDPDKFKVKDDRRITGITVMAPKNEVCAVLLRVTQVVSQLLMFSVLLGLVGYYMWADGDRDRNLVRHHERRETPLRGLWVGLIASVPALVTYVLLLLGAANLFAADSIFGVYKLLNQPFLPLIEWIVPSTVFYATQLTAWPLIALFLLQLVVPAVCAVMYQLGYRRVFKKKKKK